MVSYEEFPHSAAGLTVSVGRNNYKGYKLFCNGFFHEWPYLSHPRACPGDLKTQGTVSRYAHRKQRASAKVLAAAGVAVKLATACALQQRFSPQLVMRSSWLQIGKQNIRRLKISDDYYKKICYIERNGCIFSKPRRQSCLSAFRSLSG